jgi:hypothetical protein
MARSSLRAAIGLTIGLVITVGVEGGGVQRSQAVAQTTTSGGLSPSCRISTDQLSETVDAFFVCVANLDGSSTQEVIAGYEENFNGLNSGSLIIINNDGTVRATISLNETPNPTPTATPTITGTPSITATPTITETPSITATPTITETPSITATPTITTTPSITPTLTITETPSITSTLTIVATPTPVPVELKISPSLLNFGAVQVGSHKGPENVTVSNPKGSKKKPGLTVLMEGFSGDSNPFTVTNGCDAPLTAGEKCTIGVTFAPTAAGADKATLMIIDNAEGEPQSASLKGTGKAQKIKKTPQPTPTFTPSGTPSGTSSGSPTASPTPAFQFTVPQTLQAFIGVPYTYSFCSPVPADGICGSDADPPTTNPTGGIGQYVFSMSGDEPGGMSLDSISGLLSGTPPSENDSPYTFTVCATDQGGGEGAPSVCQTTTLTYIGSVGYDGDLSGGVTEPPTPTPEATPTPSCKTAAGLNEFLAQITVSLESSGPANVSGTWEISQDGTLCSGKDYSGTYVCTGTLSSVTGPGTLSMACVGPLVTIPITLPCSGSLVDGTSYCDSSVIGTFVNGIDSGSIVSDLPEGLGEECTSLGDC